MKKYILSAGLIMASLVLLPENNQAQSNHETKTPVVSCITQGRAKALAGSAISLLSVIVGAVAVARSKSSAGKRTGANAALVLGLIGIGFSLVHLYQSAGAVFGSGSGKAGAIVGLILGIAGLILSRIAVRRHRSHAITERS